MNTVRPIVIPGLAANRMLIRVDGLSVERRCRQHERRHDPDVVQEERRVEDDERAPRPKHYRQGQRPKKGTRR